MSNANPEKIHPTIISSTAPQKVIFWLRRTTQKKSNTKIEGLILLVSFLHAQEMHRGVKHYSYSEKKLSFSSLWHFSKHFVWTNWEWKILELELYFGSN